MPARKRRITQTEATRAKIQASQLINRLYKCAMGEVEMDPQQVSAATKLLNKVLPDLQSVEANVSNTHHVVKAEPMSLEDWERKYTAIGQDEDGDHDTAH